MFTLKHLEGAVTRVSRMIALVALAGLLVLALAIVVDVFSRWLFDAPFTGLRAAYELFISVLIASCLPLCIAARGHTTVRFLGNFLGFRVRYGLEAFGNLVTAVVFAAMAIQMWVYSNQMAMDGETVMIIGWHVSPWWRAVSIVLGICVPVQIVVFLLSVKQAITGKGLEGETGANA